MKTMILMSYARKILRTISQAHHHFASDFNDVFFNYSIFVQRVSHRPNQIQRELDGVLSVFWWPVPVYRKSSTEGDTICGWHPHFVNPSFILIFILDQLTRFSFTSIVSYWIIHLCFSFLHNCATFTHTLISEDMVDLGCSLTHFVTPWLLKLPSVWFLAEKSQVWIRHFCFKFVCFSCSNFLSYFYGFLNFCYFSSFYVFWFSHDVFILFAARSDRPLWKTSVTELERSGESYAKHFPLSDPELHWILCVRWGCEHVSMSDMHKRKLSDMQGHSQRSDVQAISGRFETAS